MAVSYPKSQTGLSAQIERYLIPASILWNIVILAGSILLSLRLFRGDEFKDLGAVVQYFIAVVALVPAVLAVLGSINLYQRNTLGRFLTLAINYIGIVLAAAFLLHLWGVFLGFDTVAAAFYDNSTWLWGIAAGYLIFWFSGRLDESGSARQVMEKAGLGVAMLSLVILLLTSNALGAILSILGSYSEPLTWVVTLAAAISGVLVYFLLKRGDMFNETPDDQVAWQGWLFVSPNLLGFLLFFAGPLLLSFYLSFTDSTGVTVPNFVGIDNYSEIMALQIKTQDNLAANPQEALDQGYVEWFSFELGDTRQVVGVKDFLFWRSLRNTIVYCLILVPLSMIPALLLAMILNSNLPGMKFYRALYFLPSVAAVVGTALIWRWLYNTQVGYINHGISQVVNGLNNLLGTQIVDPQIEWLANPQFQLASIVILGAWQVVGMNTVLFLAGLQGIPKSLYEAAFVDGAGTWGRFRNVTLPLLAPTTFFVAVTTVINGLQVFNEPYALIPSRPMPLDATTSVYYLYTRGFFRFEFGYASSVAWVVFILIFIVTLVQFRIQRSTSYER